MHTFSLCRGLFMVELATEISPKGNCRALSNRWPAKSAHYGRHLSEWREWDVEKVNPSSI